MVVTDTLMKQKIDNILPAGGTSTYRTFLWCDVLRNAKLFDQFVTSAVIAESVVLAE